MTYIPLSVTRSDIIRRFKLSTTHGCVTRCERVIYTFRQKNNDYTQNDVHNYACGIEKTRIFSENSEANNC